MSAPLVPVPAHALRMLFSSGSYDCVADGPGHGLRINALKYAIRELKIISNALLSEETHGLADDDLGNKCFELATTLEAVEEIAACLKGQDRLQTKSGAP